MTKILKRYENNPILLPGSHPWRAVATMNPGAVMNEQGEIYLFERAVSNLAPLISHVGLWKSTDGYQFELAHDKPVFNADSRGFGRGTVEDPRVTKIGDIYGMTYVFREFAPSCYPNGKGIPNYTTPSDIPEDNFNNYRTGIAVSKDLINWEDYGLISAPEFDDRDGVLFSKKINGKYAMLRRPQVYQGPQYGGIDKPAIWISYSEDLKEWTEPKLVAQGIEKWEEVKIGAGAAPLYTEAGWVLIYHGVDEKAQYKTGIMLLDKENPEKVIARSPEVIMEPEKGYEKVGLIIPNVVFPSATILKDDTIYVYYGCCDTTISVATVGLQELLDYINQFKV